MKVIDMHCDTISLMLEKKRDGEKVSLRNGNYHINLEKMRKGDYLLQNYALFVDIKSGRDPWQDVQEMFGLYTQEMLENKDIIAPVLTYGDISANRNQNKMSAMLTVEDGGVCGGDLDKLDTLYKQGVRMITLTWNYKNELGSPNFDSVKRERLRMAQNGGNNAVVNMMAMDYLNTPNTQDGLTEKGLIFVEEMERLGIIIDVSHLSDAGFYDVLKNTKKPFVASHSNARQICPCVRNLTDDMIRKLADRGGVMGLNFCADFLTQMPTGVKNPGTIQAIVKHAKHITAVGGIECIGLGSDFDGISTHKQLPGADAIGKLWDALKTSGYSESQLDKIFTDNVLRVYLDNLN